MKIRDSAWGIVLAAVLASTTGGIAIADPPLHSNPYTGDAPSHPRGPVIGNVANVDYGRGQLTVVGHGRVVVVVLPSTVIVRGEKYATLTDIQPGMHVEISVNEVNGNVIAQIIRIK
jgi:hypothetical protein